LLNWLDSTALAVWLRESPSVWALPTVLTLHAMGMGVLVGASWMLDLRVLGINRHVPFSGFRWVFPVVGVGLAVNLVTGVLLFVKNPTTWATSIPFLIKMVLVVASVATLVPLRSLVSGAAATHGDSGGGTYPAARVWAIVSILAWTGAVTAGRLLAYVQP
jgi:hypothetical protein